MEKQAVSLRTRDLPWATIIIIIANLLVTILASFDFKDMAMDYGLVPANLTIGRFITSTLIHDGFVHLAINMIFLYVFGCAMERAVGKLEFVLFYIGACMAASLMHVAIVFAALPLEYARQPVVGASGAVAGVMGLYAVRFHRRRFKLDGFEVSALFLILVWLVFQIALGAVALNTESILGIRLRYIAYWSHLGGFAFGVIIAMIANMALQGEREHLIQEGQSNFEQGNLLEAAQIYESLLKHDPDNPLANAELGKLWAIMDEESQSVPYFRAAVNLYIRAAQEDQAIEAAKEMKRYWPDFMLTPAERFRLASYLEETGQQDRAIAAFKEIADKSPDSEEAQMSLLKIGQLQLTALRNAPAAIVTIKDFLNRYPESEWRSFAEETLVRAECR